MTKPLHVRTARGPRYAPGHKRIPGSGRAKGTPNKVSADAKAMMDALVEHGLSDAVKVYDKLKKKSPEGALKALARLAEFRLPKLQRSIIEGGDKPVRTIEVVEYVSGSAPAGDREAAVSDQPRSTEPEAGQAAVRAPGSHEE